jgi:hypothetical protein
MGATKVAAADTPDDEDIFQFLQTLSPQSLDRYGVRWRLHPAPLNLLALTLISDHL